MKKKKDNATNAASLRQKAEEHLKKRKSKTASVLSEADMLKQLHELEVHQIELEMQNEELVLAKKRIEELAEKKYKELYDFAPTGYISLTKEGKITELNLAAAKKLGKERLYLIKSRLASYLSDNTRSVFNLFIEKVFASKVRQSCEVTIETEENSPICVVINGVVSQNDETCLLTLVNITERKQAEKALRESEEHFQLLFNKAPLSYQALDFDGNIIEVNQQWLDTLGYEREEVIGKGLGEFMTPKYKKLVKDRFLLFKAQGKTQSEYEMVHKNGSVLVIAFVGRIGYGLKGEFKQTHCILQDITERKRAEKIKQMQYNIAQAKTTARNLNELFDSIKKELNSLIDAKNLVIALYDEETGMLSANVERDEKDEIPVRPVKKSLTGYVIKQNRPVLLRKNEILSLHEEGIIEIHGTIPEAWLGAPLKVDGKMLGTVVVQNYDNPDVYDQSAIEILELAAHELSVFIDWQRSKEKANKLSRAIEQVSVSVVITNKEGLIEYVNPFFKELSGYSLEEIKGKKSNILKSGHHSTAFYQELWDTVLSGKNWKGEFLNKKKNGELYWDKAVITPVVNSEGTITNFIAVREDITERKKMVEELVATKEKAEESDKLKTAFINNISHEIRTPLNGILGFGTLLSETDPSPEDKEEMLAYVQHSSNRLMNTVTDYMDMAQIVSGTMEVQKKEFLLQPFFEEAIEETKQLCDGKKIGFEADYQDDHDLTLDSDPELIKRILNILLDNALKFTTKGSIRCGYEVKEGFIEFFVQDTGKGIAPGKRDAIFNMFTQENTLDTRAHEGSGLGLSIANGLVKLLGGAISATSEQGKGSTFAFTVPYKEEQLEEKAPPEEEKNAAVEGKPLVLIAEDEESCAMYLEVVLKKAGFDYLLAKNGEEAVAFCKQHPGITLVLMDIKMPVMNGLEATKRIREFRPELPIIATTAYAQTGDEQRLMAAGFDGYLPKPTKRENLLAVLQKYVKS